MCRGVFDVDELVHEFIWKNQKVTSLLPSEKNLENKALLECVVHRNGVRVWESVCECVQVC